MEEEYEASRTELVSSVNCVHAQQVMKSEIKELKSLVAAVAGDKLN